jgi:branched-chain amino acid transport system substrate-binding protein
MRLFSFFLALWVLCLTPAVGQAGQTIKVAAIFSKTGKAALSNTHALAGIRFAIKDVNQQGGVLGKPIELVEFDNQSTALGSKTAAKQAVAAGVVTAFGASWSSHSLAMAPIFQNARIPMISPNSTHREVTLAGDFIFRVCYTDPFQGRLMANFAFQDLKAETAAVLVNVDRKYSEGLADAFIRSYGHQGGKIVFVEDYLEKTADFTPILKKIQTVQPQVIFHPGHTKVSAFVLKQARDMGILTPFIGGDAWNDSMYGLVGNLIEGSFYSTHWHPDMPGKKNRQFIERYQQRSRTFDPGNALSEEAVLIFRDAVGRAKSIDPVKIRNAIAATENFIGITGNIRFDQNGDPIKSAVILKFEKGGSVYVKTIAPWENSADTARLFNPCSSGGTQ